MKKLIIIFNPNSGPSPSQKTLDLIVPTLKRNNFDLNIITTQYPGHEKVIANTVDLYDVSGVCIIGGDGTINQVVNGMFLREDNIKLPLGIIPAGTGNSFMHDIGVLDPEEAVKNIIKEKIKFIDIAKIKMKKETVFSINIIGWGLVTDINVSAEKFRWLGSQRYNLTTLLHVLTNKKRKAKLFVDGEELNQKFSFIIACNTIHTGKGMKIAPKAKLDDGLLDLIVVPETQIFKLLTMFPKIFDGSHLGHEVLQYYQVKEFSLKPSIDESLNLDGEVYGKTPIDVSVIKHGLSIYA